MEDAQLIIRQGARVTFVDSLKDAKGEITLTPSDVPYTFMLRKSTDEDNVLTIDDWPETEVPLVLESERLGIRLVINASGEPAKPIDKSIRPLFCSEADCGPRH